MPDYSQVVLLVPYKAKIPQTWIDLH